MDKQTLLKICNNHFVNDELLKSLNETFNKYQIDSNLRQCHFLAQILHESGSFQYTKELASGKAYEGRKDLGNFNLGDGQKYKGRGLIQITGKFNYQALSNELNADFIEHPDLLEKFPYACLSAGWYWNSRNLNELADNDDFLMITKKINGGVNGLEDRKRWLEICKKILYA